MADPQGSDDQEGRDRGRQDRGRRDRRDQDRRDPRERLSRRLSYLLRHDPAAVGIELSPDGWVDLHQLVEAMTAHGDRVTVDEVVDVLATATKQRFELADNRIRALQGHSIPVDLGLSPTPPPQLLYHGTVARFLPGIRRDGLHRGSRTHVHLSPDRQTAIRVGQRRGRPVVLTIRAQEMHRAGHTFLRAANGVWLTTHVPPHYIDPDTP